MLDYTLAFYAAVIVIGGLATASLALVAIVTLTDWLRGGEGPTRLGREILALEMVAMDRMEAVTRKVR